MIHSVDLDDKDFKRLFELKRALGTKNKSETFRYCLREVYKNFFPDLLTLDSDFNGQPPSRFLSGDPAVPPEVEVEECEALDCPHSIDGKTDAIFDLVRSALDVSEHRETEKRREMELKAAAAAARARSHFFSTMSHEIRTPLNAVIGFTELLRSGDISPEEQREYLESINVSGNALLALIDDALDLIRLEAGQLDISPAPTDFASLLEETRAFFAGKAREKKLDFAVTGAEALPELYLDAARMRQILLKLVGNAIKFTSQGKISLEAKFVRRKFGTGTLTVAVSDTGIGIADAHRKQLFLPVSRQYPVHHGPGLGLTMVKRLLARMDGDLECRSVENEGSTFIIKLEKVRYVTRSNADGDRNRKTLSPLSKSLKVLLVDDVPTNLRLLEAMLKRLGQQPLCAASGEQAFELFSRDDFDVVMTDLWMPEMNGAELASRIRDRGAGPVLAAVTADVEYSANFDTGLFDAVLTKPVTPEKIRRLLEEIMRPKEK